MKTRKLTKYRFKALLYKKILDDTDNSFMQNQNKYEDVGIDFKCNIIEGKYKQFLVSEMVPGITTIGSTTVIITDKNPGFALKDKLNIPRINSGHIISWDEITENDELAYRKKSLSKEYVVVIS